MAAAGGTVAGGHTIRSDEPIFGLAVQGLVHPDRVWTKAGARPGDRLVLSKPLGTGIVLAGGPRPKTRRPPSRSCAASTGTRGGGAGAPCVADGDGPHAVTDVTGFGLLGHGWEMAERSGVTLRFDAAALPLYPGALAAAERGTRTGGDARNRAHLEGRVTSTASPALEALGYDPQTSGGLLAAVDARPAPSGWWPPGSGFVAIGEVVAGARRGRAPG